ncbi:MAG: XdhC family protein [Treponema sp.]|jgi:xanthine dehydrogenase accessory factor|nr:XdhC family protein [Treponema sp.]
MKLKELFTAVLNAAGTGEDTVLATIITEAGSSPRSAGAHMLAGKEGRICGTIGGGTLEYRALQAARELLTLQTSQCKSYHLHPNDEEDLGMLCGGDLEVYFQFIPGGDRQIMCLMRDLLRRLEQDSDTWLFMDLSSPAVRIMAPYTAGMPFTGMELSRDEIKTLARGKPVFLKTGERRLYGEPVNFAGKVIIFGGGHVAQALEPVLSTVGFRCVIFDNREEFVQPELFPTACRLIAGDYHAVFRHIEIGPGDYVVIVTHAFDIPVLRQVIQKDCAYLGVIGSKGKVAAVKQHLRSEGVGEEKLAAMNAPIGLKIRSETPEEIAVSIAGEMILRRAERRDSLATP